MKQRLSYKKYFLSAALLVTVITGLVSCKKYLQVEPVSSFGTDYVFDNIVNAEKAVLGVYSRLCGDAGYGIRVSMYYPYDDDIMMGQGGTPYPDNERRDIAHYRASANNTQLAAPFNQMYAGIEWANLCIYNIPKMDMYTNGSPGQIKQLQRLYGEALTLRAQFYLEALRNWGDLPAQFLPSSVDKDLFKGKTDRDSIYNVLLDDLATAASMLPWRNEVAKEERITQGAARGLRARIALFRGGWSLRRSGGMQRGSDHLTYYQIARDECRAIMESNQHNLNTSFESVFKNYIAGKQIEPNGEVIWEVGMGGGNSALGDSKLGYYCGPQINDNGNSALTVLPTYFYMFDSMDRRRDVMCVPYEAFATGTTITRVDAHSLSTMMDGKFRRTWIVPAGYTIGPQYFGVNWPLLRFSDVLLMFAEAENEINNGPTADAKNAFEKVRLRAFNNDVSLIGVTPTTKAGFFSAIVKERALELGGEGIRKYDLIRWNMLESKFTETKANLALMATRTAPYDNVPEYMYFQANSPTLVWANPSYYKPDPFAGTAPAGFTRVDWARATITTTILMYYAEDFNANKNELLPIPQASIDANPLLKQDYGY